MRRNLPRPFSRRSIEKSFRSLSNSLDSMMLSMFDSADVRPTRGKNGSNFFGNLTASGPAFSRSLVHDGEISLVLEDIDSRDHHFQDIAHREAPPRLPADETSPDAIEDIEVVVEELAMNQPGQRDVGHLNEQAVVANLDHDRAKNLRIFFG